MNILLIQPRFQKSETSYPLGLGYIAACLKQAGHSVQGVDLSFGSFHEVISLIKTGNINLLGVSLMSFSFNNALSFCVKIKELVSVPIVVGGPHATVFKDKLMENYNKVFDYVIVGQGELPFIDLAQALEQGKPLSNIPGLIYRKDGRVVSNQIKDCANQLDNLAPPDRSIFPIKEYKGMTAKYGNYTQIIASRGCNHSCHHCPEPLLWGEWQGRSVEDIVNEIKELKIKYKINDIHFEDANFFGGGVESVRALCQGMIDGDLNIKWQCPNGIPIVDIIKDESILELMAQAGCYSICLGIETFDKNFMPQERDYFTFDEVEKLVKSAQAAGIEVVGYFMIGMPHQTFNSILNDIYLSQKLGLDFLHYSLFHFIPGSKVYSSIEKLGSQAHSSNEHNILQSVKYFLLRLVRTCSLVINCFHLKSLKYIWNNFWAIKNPFKFLRRAIVYLFDVDIKI